MSVFLLSYRPSTPTYGPGATRIRMPALAMPPMVSPRSFSTRSACRTCAGDMPAGCCRRSSTIGCRIWESGRGRVGQRGGGDGGGFGGAADSNPGWPIRDFHLVTIRSSSCAHRPVRRSRCPMRCSRVDVGGRPGTSLETILSTSWGHLVDVPDVRLQAGHQSLPNAGLPLSPRWLSRGFHLTCNGEHPHRSCGIGHFETFPRDVPLQRV